jgi:hypothetical protein
MDKALDFLKALLRQVRGTVESDYVPTRLKNDEQILLALADILRRQEELSRRLEKIEQSLPSKEKP